MKFLWLTPNLLGGDDAWTSACPKAATDRKGRCRTVVQVKGAVAQIVFA